MGQAWDDYVEKRNAYLAAAGFPKRLKEIPASTSSSLAGIVP
jgi:hypothetical protein